MRRLRRAHQRHAKKSKKFKRRAIVAGTTAAIMLGTGSSLHKAYAAPTTDSHQLPVDKDADADLLANSEEIAIGYRVFNPDQNHNEILDGAELAERCFADVNDLPEWIPSSGKPEPDESYKTILAAAYGIETCAVCGKDDIVMVLWEVVNPQNGISVQLTNMGLHFLEHGSFNYHSLDDWSGKDRVDVPALIQALGLPYEPDKHQLPVAEDADTDLLANAEELAIGYRVFKPDQNRNEIPDGLELAIRCAAVVKDLPQWYGQGDPPNQIYKFEHALDGLETCDICSQEIHMGGWEIFNPKLQMRFPDPNDPLDATFLPDLALHYMEHGSFDCRGEVHSGRVNIARLLRVLELRFSYDPNEHQLPLDYVVKPAGQLAPDANDLDGDLLADSEELAAGYNLYNPDQDNDLNPDGIEFAKQCAQVIDALPVYTPDSNTPAPEQTYKINFFQRGIELCEICGLSVNMGYWKVINPKLGLSVDLYDITFHYMSHGSLSYSGELHNGRVDIAVLAKLLEMPNRCGDLGTLYLPGDLNEDCRMDFADLAELADKWLESTEPNEN